MEMRLYGESVESDTFYGDFMAKFVWDFHGENMVNQITKQSPYQLDHKISIKNFTLHTVFMLST